MADKPKRPERFDLKSAGSKSGRLVPILGTAVVVVFAVAVGFGIMHNLHNKKPNPVQTGASDAVRVTSSKLVTQPGTNNPKVVMTFYEDFLCPACGSFERSFGPTVSKLIDIGAIAADFAMVSILDRPQTQNYSSRAGAAALCVADVSVDAFRTFHSALYSKDIQPSETDTSFPDNARLIEIARESGAAGTVPDCINSGKYLSKVSGEAATAGITGTPTVKINGEEYKWSSPAALVAAIKQIVGDVPGIDSAAATATS